MMICFWHGSRKITILRVAQWSQEDPDADDPLNEDEEIPASNQWMLVSARLRFMEDRPHTTRPFKFGSCPRHGTALRPRIWSASSKNAGRGALVCSRFWKRDETTNRPQVGFAKKCRCRKLRSCPDSTASSTNSFKIASCTVADRIDRFQRWRKKRRCPMSDSWGHYSQASRCWVQHFQRYLEWKCSCKYQHGHVTSLGCRCRFQHFHGSL